jgi:hypothetical protein
LQIRNNVRVLTFEVFCSRNRRSAAAETEAAAAAVAIARSNSCRTSDGHSGNRFGEENDNVFARQRRATNYLSFNSLTVPTPGSLASADCAEPLSDPTSQRNYVFVGYIEIASQMFATIVSIYHRLSQLQISQDSRNTFV